jgi:hypothetical protein
MPQNISESRALVVREAPSGKSGRLLIGVISPGWGSSGYYSQPVLENAGADRVFPAGTHMFIDHPSESEKLDRPERSIRDLAAVLTEDAYWDADLGMLVGEAQVFGPYRDTLTDEEFASSIGVSIRATAEVRTGEAEGRQGRIITNLLEGESVDFVTKAGRGGKVLSVLESARQDVLDRATAHGVEEATVRDTEQALGEALKEKFGADRTYVWVRDFDESTVWYQLETPDESATYALAYTITDALVVTFDGEPSKVTARTEYVPAAEAAAAEADHTEESQEDAMSETEEAAGVAPEGTTTDPAAPAAETSAAESGTDSSSEEQTMTNPTGAGGTAPQNPRQVMEARLTAQESVIAEMRASQQAGPIIAEVLASGWIGDQQRSRLAAELMQSIPMAEGRLDEAALRTAAEAALERAETEAAEILQAAGVGTPRGLGALTSPATEAAGAQTKTQLAESFKALGLSDAAADIAVKGR